MRSRSPSNRHKRNKIYTEEKYKKIIISEKEKEKPQVQNYIEKINVILQPEQQQLLKHLRHNDSLLIISTLHYDKFNDLFHLCESFLNDNNENNITYISSDDNITCFENEIHKFTDNIHQYKFYSNNINDLDIICSENTLFIIDELTCRNIMSPKFSKLFECSVKSNKRIVITSSPFINTMLDFVPIINLLYGKIYVQISSDKYLYNISESINSLNTVKTLLNSNVFIRDIVNKNLPTISDDKIINTCVSSDFINKYNKLVLESELKNYLEDVFYYPEKYEKQYKKILLKNNISEYIEKKIYSLIPYINNKSLIFSYTFVIEQQKRILEEQNFKVCVYDKSSEDVLKKFNNDEYDIILVSKILDENITLKGVRNIFCLEPTWNYTLLQNILEKCVNLDSHIYLPLEERNVQIYHCILDLTDDREESGDIILYKLFKKKYEMNEKIIKELKDSKNFNFDFNSYQTYVNDIFSKLEERKLEDFTDIIKDIVDTETKTITNFKKRLYINRLVNLLFSESKTSIIEKLYENFKEYIIYKYEERNIKEINESKNKVKENKITFSVFVKNNLNSYLEKYKNKNYSEIVDIIKKDWREIY